MSPPTLIDMPELVLDHILEKVDLRAILVLRKTCHTLRNFIEEAHPESKIDSLSITFNPDFIYMVLPWNIIRANYRKHENGCQVNKKVIKDHDYLEMFLNDLKIILENQKTGVKFFNVYFKSFDLKDLKILGQTLESWTNPFPVKTLKVEILNQTQAMAVLPYLDPKIIEVLEISTTESLRIDIDRIVELDLWKNLKAVQFYKIYVRRAYLDCFSHSERVIINMEFVGGQELGKIMEMFLTSSKMTTFLISATYINIGQYITLLGEPQVDISQYGPAKYKWEVSHKDRILQFTLSGSMNDWRVCVDWKRLE